MYDERGRCIYWRLLRPELLAQLRDPNDPESPIFLSSDTFSGFGWKDDENAESYIEDVDVSIKMIDLS